MKRIGGFRRKSRYKMQKKVSEMGKVPIGRFLQEFEEGQKVLLKAYPSYHKGLFCLRFYGRIADVTGKQGDCYKVSLRDGGKQKTFVVHPVHMLKV
ncbi:50S ribosomal protein L21e [Candidatus Woesearchaeota archaeon]|nr:50S ribosomal protein L21e [Nanoarchaeota archaeon]MCB9370969.1 50S ribosomal protein L21e [Candidatus Woesearchaeota archaeon]USN44070.1 MAG: 50S ribosomal protein L21e [Candidatus Woesearchaeota archaeon]